MENCQNNGHWPQQLASLKKNKQAETTNLRGLSRNQRNVVWRKCVTWSLQSRHTTLRVNRYAPHFSQRPKHFISFMRRNSATGTWRRNILLKTFINYIWLESLINYEFSKQVLFDLKKISAQPASTDSLLPHTVHKDPLKNHMVVGYPQNYSHCTSSVRALYKELITSDFLF